MSMLQVRRYNSLTYLNSNLHNLCAKCFMNHLDVHTYNRVLAAFTFIGRFFCMFMEIKMQSRVNNKKNLEKCAFVRLLLRKEFIFCSCSLMFAASDYFISN